MLLRTHHFSRLKDKSDFKSLGNFSVVCSKQQAFATKSLYDYLVSRTGEEECVADTMVLVHKLLVSLVHHEIHGTRKMECPTDQSLFLVSLRLSPQGTLQFQPANQLTHDCATLQYWFFAIVTHVARLQAGGKEEFSFFSNENQAAVCETVLSELENSTIDQEQEVVSPLNDPVGEPEGVVDDDETEDEAESELEPEVEEQDVERSSAMNILR